MENMNWGFQTPTIGSNYNVLFRTLTEFASSFQIILTSENDVQSNRLRDLLSELMKSC
jgi:hypothetical protein